MMKHANRRIANLLEDEKPADSLRQELFAGDSLYQAACQILHTRNRPIHNQLHRMRNFLQTPVVRRRSFEVFIESPSVQFSGEGGPETGSDIQPWPWQACRSRVFRRVSIGSAGHGFRAREEKMKKHKKGV
jgi:hypothetical protein